MQFLKEVIEEAKKANGMYEGAMLPFNVPIKTIGDVLTRWGSLLAMLKRFKLLKQGGHE
jgi:hypothetical protein